MKAMANECHAGGKQLKSAKRIYAPIWYFPLTNYGKRKEFKKIVLEM